MEYENDNGAMNFLTGLVCGAAIGAGIAILMAPESGKRTRRRITRAAEDLRFNAGDRWEDIADEVRDKVEEALDGARKRFNDS